MKKLLVASIYSSVSTNNGWYDIQRKFFDLTTEDYDFGVFCNRVDPKYFPGAIILGEHTSKSLKEHFDNEDYQPDDEDLSYSERRYCYDIRVAYFKIMDYFREHADEYENFLLIDCDAFPVCPDWQNVLNSKLKTWKKWYATLLRSENFESYPWLGLMYIQNEYIHEDIPDWFPRKYENTWGDKFREFGTTRIKTHHEGECIWYPLVRSNVLNLHPIRFGIYNHLFYHHMKGSWDKSDRQLNLDPEVTVNSIPEMYGYYDHYIPRKNHALIAEHCHERLIRDPENFICQLMGVDSSWFKGKI